MAYRQQNADPRHTHDMVCYPNDFTYRYCTRHGCTYAERWNTAASAYLPARGRPRNRPTADPLPLFPDLPPVPASVRAGRRIRRDGRRA